MEPKISREFYLLCLNPKNGYYFNFGNEFGYGLLGSLLLDLYKNGKIGIRQKKLVLIDAQRTNYQVFDKVIDLLEKKGPLSIPGVLYKMGFRSISLKKEFIQLMENNKDIFRQRKKFLGIPYSRYYPINSDIRTSIIRRIRDILLRGAQPSPDEMLLLPLIHTGRLYRALSDQRLERKFMRKKMKDLLKNPSFYSNYDEVRLFHDGIRKVITASNAAQHAG